MSTESVQTLIRDLRGEQEHHLPIFLRMGAGRVRDEVRLAVKAGADGIVLLGLETPPLSDPAGLLQYCRLPMMRRRGESPGPGCRCGRDRAERPGRARLVPVSAGDEYDDDEEE
jgi:hypothetical protein